MDTLFKILSNTLDGLPPEAIYPTLELEKHMLEEDILQNRIDYDQDVTSVLAFCRMINSLKAGDHADLAMLPTSHILYYRQVIWRLVRAGELPEKALQEFDNLLSNEWTLLNS